MTTTRTKQTAARAPLATYRLQLHKGFAFGRARAVTETLARMGISAIYASPVATARPGSLHGYDVTDHAALNPELGGEAGFLSWARGLKKRNMGLIIDVVPNHMCVADPGNRWWMDVLENGPASPFAAHFDIEWRPLKINLENKILLPILGDQYGKALENQEITLVYEEDGFFVRYYAHRLPLAPESWGTILTPIAHALKANGAAQADTDEIDSILTAIDHLPPRTEADPALLDERRREKDVIKRRWAELNRKSAAVRTAFTAVLRALNGEKGNPHSFDRLETLLEEQAYRLSHWRVATDEINYRRFFDINELAAIRVEEPAVFDAVHALLLRFVKAGLVTGLRVDHVDGLLDPQGYLENVQAACRAAVQVGKPGATDAGGPAEGKPSAGAPAEAPLPVYTVVEKILVDEERLPEHWPVHGTTGYDFANQLNRLFVRAGNRRAFQKLTRRFTGQTASFQDVLVTCKKLILLVSNASELRALASQLDEISEQHRWSRDFTLDSLRYALREVIACFPAYRTYLRETDGTVRPAERKLVETAVLEARRRNPATSPSIFDFIGAVLLLDEPEGLMDAQRHARRRFILGFQQLTGPVMAKGAEDTAFYRYFPLASLNEVGGDPDRFGAPAAEFHRANQARLARWPDAMIATTTHDAKRSEDVRARLNVLSEVPVKWYRSIRRWQVWNQAHKTALGGQTAPCANEEYLIYQTLVGTWPGAPLAETARQAWEDRIVAYTIKAIKEAKVHTSWVNPNERYEHAVAAFVRAILKPNPRNRFLKDFTRFMAPVATAGQWNALGQTLLKTVSPGVPDFYQGTEVWNLSLVDPDNRRPVDFGRIATLEKALSAVPEKDLGKTAERLMRAAQDGRIKFWVMTRALKFRKDVPALFARGAYIPLSLNGPFRSEAVAFARRFEKDAAIAVAGRFFTRLGAHDRPAFSGERWRNTDLLITDPALSGRYRDVLTGRTFTTRRAPQGSALRMAEILHTLPVALLEKVN